MYAWLECLDCGIGSYIKLSWDSENHCPDCRGINLKSLEVRGE